MKLPRWSSRKQALVVAALAFALWWTHDVRQTRPILFTPERKPCRSIRIGDRSFALVVVRSDRPSVRLCKVHEYPEAFGRMLDVPIVEISPWAFWRP